MTDLGIKSMRCLNKSQKSYRTVISLHERRTFFFSVNEQLRVRVWERVMNGKTDTGVKQLEIYKKISFIKKKKAEWKEVVCILARGTSQDIRLKLSLLRSHQHSQASPGVPCRAGEAANESGARRAHSPRLTHQISHVLLGEEGERVGCILLESGSSLPLWKHEKKRNKTFLANTMQYWSQHLFQDFSERKKTLKTFI